MATEDLLRLELFTENLGEVLEIGFDDRAPFELEIAEATGMPGDSDAREPFSVLFRSRDELVLPQRVYRLEHEKIGSLELFLVPLGPDREVEGAMLYEAAFS